MCVLTRAWQRQKHLCHRVLDDEAHAIMELEAITAGTQDYMAWRALGDIYFEKEQYQQAVECYQV